MKARVYHIVLLVLLGAGQTLAQPVYNMSNAVVNDCKGTLFDSDKGKKAGDYDHNEDYTFTICVPGASSISLSFSAFCTEALLDTIRFFNGPDINSPKIGPTYSGTTSPGTIISAGDCLTIHFKSDEDVACSGWQATWTTDVPDPVPPVITSLGNVFCETTNLTLKFDKQILCSSISSGNFNITGTFAPVIDSVHPFDCADNMTDSLILFLAKDFSQNGTYTLHFVYRVLDECDSLWTFPVSTSFSLTDCPLKTTCIGPAVPICEKTCTTIRAETTGGDSTTYVYQWTPFLPPTAGPHVICPDTTTVYEVIVSDAAGSKPDTDLLIIFVTPLPDAGSDTTVCHNSGIVNLGINTPGAKWTGLGITDTLTGLFDPSLAGTGSHIITYDLNNCRDTMIIDVKQIDAGTDIAGCLGSSPFPLSGIPAGGLWSGSVYVNPAGLFNPAAKGSYKLAYTFAGCTDSITVIVDTIALQANDSICQNSGDYSLAFLPPNGQWTGPGITNPVNGIFNPVNSGWHQLIYTIEGCSDTLDIFVKPISAGQNEYACPAAPPFALAPANPAGGIWKGKAVTDTLTGIFDPGFFGGNNFTDTLSYTFDGCTARKIMYVVKTAISTDTIRMCESDPVYTLSATYYEPPNGIWSGKGILSPAYPGTFDPAVAGPGIHKLIYDANTCADSLFIEVYPKVIIQNDTTVCIGSGTFHLDASPAGGSWAGPGLSSSGLFNSVQAGSGIHIMTYTSPDGCSASMNIEVNNNPVSVITVSDSVYCSRNQPLLLSGTPAGGVWNGPGISGNDFNPSLAGTGFHTIYYTVSSKGCASTDSMKIRVLAPLQATLMLSDDTICYGETVNVLATAFGGLSAYSFSWDNGLDSKPEQTLRPLQTSTYQVTVSDSCSDPVTKSFTVFVHEEIRYSISLSDAVCFGDSGYAYVTPEPGRTYAYSWKTDPPVSGSDLNGIADDYLLTITDLNSSCTIDTLVGIPRHSIVKAFFTPNPVLESCYSITEPALSFIDRSEGGVTGAWSFGDGQSQPYVFGVNPVHAYADTGAYLVSLTLVNAAGCSSVYEQSVCFEPRSEVYAPGAFSPNGDGINDKFYVTLEGGTDFSLSIYDRWGNRVHYTDDPSPDKGWDGNLDGQTCSQGAYVYFVSYKDIITKKSKSRTGTLILAW